MTHPKYQIVEVRVKDGNRSEEVVSKELMFKCDAERVVNYKNKQDSYCPDFDNMHYWMIRHYEKKTAW